jgi:trehalose 6-phosphate phosphatase
MPRCCASAGASAPPRPPQAMVDREVRATGGARNGASARPRQRRRGPPPLLHPGCALFLDIDGTLLELAPTPDSVSVDAGIAALLPALAHRLQGAVALITGRSMADADRLFRGLKLPIAGQHGLERRAADGSLHRHLPSLYGLERLRRDLTEFAARHDGLMLEDKGATLALHYRQAPRLASHVHRTLRAHLSAAVASEAGWRLQPGKGILEVKPDGRDKGTVILEYMEEPPFSRRLPVFVGDDRTDEYGFIAVTVVGGWAVKVGRGPTNANYRLPNVAAVRKWLSALESGAGGTKRSEDVA